MRHPDEGTIHAWLDGALPDDEARELDAHVAECEACAAAVAEARGLTAGASRILAALDAAPAGVTPRQPAASIPQQRQRAWWRRPGVGIAAAMAIVAVGSTWAVTRRWAADVPSAFESTAPVALSTNDTSERQLEAAPSATVPTSPPSPAPVRADAGIGGVAAEAEPARAQALVGAGSGVASGERAEATANSVEERLTAQRELRGRDARQAKTETDAAAPLRIQVADVTIPDSIRQAAAPMPAAASRRSLADAPPIESGRTLARTVRDVAGCYALELGGTAPPSAPALPTIVRLAETAEEAASALRAPAAAPGFATATQPLLVPPALDSGQLGWRMAMSDSVSLRLPADGRTVQVVFPAAVPGGVGEASAVVVPGASFWRAPVTVQRVACPNR